MDNFIFKQGQVEKFANAAAFPNPGNPTNVYYDETAKTFHLWNGATYDVATATPSNDSDLVHITGAETITGNKVFNGTVVFNEAGADVDYRFEGSTVSNLFRTDAGNDRVIVGSGFASSKFTVRGDSDETQFAVYGNTASQGNPLTAWFSNTGANVLNIGNDGRISRTNGDIILGPVGSSGNIIFRTWGGGVFTNFYADATDPRVHIGSGATPNASALLELTANDKGFLPPRMTGVQATVVTGVNGLILYVTSTNGVFTSIGHWVYESGAWVKMTSMSTYGEFYFKDNTTETALTVNTPAKIGGGTYSAGNSTSDMTVATGRCTFTGLGTITVMCSGTLTAQNIDGGSPDYVFYFAKNGTLIGKSAAERDIGAAEASIAFQCVTTMTTNDYIECWVENVSDNDDIVVQDINAIIHKIG